MSTPDDGTRPLTQEEWLRLVRDGVHPGPHWDGTMQAPPQRRNGIHNLCRLMRGEDPRRRTGQR